MRLDRSKPYGSITGHSAAKYEQNGVLFDAAGVALPPPPALMVDYVPADQIIETDEVHSARLFLMNVLSSGPRNKSVIYKASEENNQSWEDVKKAFSLIGGRTFTFNRATMWKLPEEGVN
jgi:hypothetical protein